MKARWLLITLLLAFPFAFAFFLREARLGEKRPAKPALVIAPSLMATPASDADRSESRPSELTADIPPSASIAPTAVATPPPTDAKPVLLQGTFAKEDRSLIYDADAKLQLSKDVILSSPTGVMVSNEKQTVFAGDMQIESGKNIITAHEGVLDTNANQMKATVASISFTNENNQLVRMTGENVTLDLPSNQSSTPNKTIVAESIKVEAVPNNPAPSTTP